MLRTLKCQNTLPWFCARDFNEILQDDEKLGGSLRPAKQMDMFRDVIIECGFNEVKISDSKYTWSRGKLPNLIREWLDRGFASDSWLQLFPWSKEKHLASAGSDHVPFLFHISSNQQVIKTIKRTFRFENMWTKKSRVSESYF